MTRKNKKGIMNDYKVDENSLYDSMNKVKEAKRHWMEMREATGIPGKFEHSVSDLLHTDRLTHKTQYTQ